MTGEQVQVERVDRFKRQIDFRIVRNTATRSSRKSGQRPQQARTVPKELAALRKQRRADRLKSVRQQAQPLAMRPATTPTSTSCSG